MKTTRNWSGICDFQGGNFGQRKFYTRQDWIETCMEWCYGGMPIEEYEQLEDEEREYLDWLNSLSDEDLMHYISNNWEIGIRETTWLEEGNDCYWVDPKGQTSGVYTILEIRFDEDDCLSDTSVLLITDGQGENEVYLQECYGLTNEVCPKCGSQLYVSDLCQYQHVCLKCDENFN